MVDDQNKIMGISEVAKRASHPSNIINHVNKLKGFKSAFIASLILLGFDFVILYLLYQTSKLPNTLKITSLLVMGLLTIITIINVLQMTISYFRLPKKLLHLKQPIELTVERISNNLILATNGIMQFSIDATEIKVLTTDEKASKPYLQISGWLEKPQVTLFLKK